MFVTNTMLTVIHGGSVITVVVTTVFDNITIIAGNTVTNDVIVRFVKTAR